jgi:hypothetical protein
VKFLAEVLEESDRLVLFGPHTPETVSYWKLDPRRVELGGLLPAQELLRRLRAEFEVLFVPMSFEVAGHAANMKVGFPSKIADYTATGVPMLICGPAYCSAVRWALANSPCAEVVTSEANGELRAAIDRLRSLPHRQFLGSQALKIGRQLFSHEVVTRRFLSALQTLGKVQPQSIDCETAAPDNR